MLYNDSGTNTGVAGSTNAEFGNVVALVNAMGNNGSTEPAKRFYKYARPYRWSSNVVLIPALVPAIPRLSFRLWVALRMVSALAP